MDGLVFSELTADWLEQAHELEHKTFFTVKSDDLYSLDEMAEDLAKLPGGNFMVVDPAASHRLVGMGLGTLIDVDPTDPGLVLSEIDGQADEKEFSLSTTRGTTARALPATPTTEVVASATSCMCCARVSCSP